MKQKMMWWQLHQLDHMQNICTSLQTDNHAIIAPLSFYRSDALPAAQPTASRQHKRNIYHFKYTNLKWYLFGWVMLYVIRYEFWPHCSCYVWLTLHFACQIMYVDSPLSVTALLFHSGLKTTHIINPSHLRLPYTLLTVTWPAYDFSSFFIC